MKRLRLEKITFVLLLSLLITGVSAQTKALLSVTGKVTDTSGTELAGVTVLHKDAKSAAWKNSLQILTEKNDTAGVLSLTERALHELPEVPEFYFYRSIALYQQQKYEEALQTNFTAIENLLS